MVEYDGPAMPTDWRTAKAATAPVFACHNAAIDPAIGPSGPNPMNETPHKMIDFAAKRVPPPTPMAARAQALST